MNWIKRLKIRYHQKELQPEVVSEGRNESLHWHQLHRASPTGCAKAQNCLGGGPRTPGNFTIFQTLVQNVDEMPVEISFSPGIKEPQMASAIHVIWQRKPMGSYEVIPKTHSPHLQDNSMNHPESAIPSAKRKISLPQSTMLVSSRHAHVCKTKCTSS